MKKNIRLIGFDLDGTLLTKDKTITENSREVLRRAIDQGIVVLPATGRPLSGVPKEILEFPGIQYALTANGARIIELDTGKMIYESLVPVDTAQKVLKVFEKYDTLSEVYFDGNGFGNEKELAVIEEFFIDPALAQYVRSTRQGVKCIKEKVREENRPLDKVHGVFKHMREKEEAREELKSIEGITVTGALANNLEVNYVGVNKGNGLLHLAELLGIEKSEVMACGDGMNDLEMMKAVGFSVAMANGEDEVKAMADYVTSTNDEEGVAKAIEKFALN